MMKKIAVVLSGCGNLDGSEIQETLSALLAIDRRGWSYQCFAPEGLFEVVRYTKSQEEDGEEGSVVDVESRDIFEESGRLVRGNVMPLATYKPEDYDALLLPGGFGAARNLSTFYFDGPNMVVIDGVQDAIYSTYCAKKPVCAMCIAPMLLAKVLGRYEVKLTLGGTCDPSAIAEKFGCHHQVCGVREACVDEEHKIITTPAYMVGQRISEIFDGAEAMVSALEKMLG